jgi:hypothetical protein
VDYLFMNLRRRRVLLGLFAGWFSCGRAENWRDH